MKTINRVSRLAITGLVLLHLFFLCDCLHQEKDGDAMGPPVQPGQDEFKIDDWEKFLGKSIIIVSVGGGYVDFRSISRDTNKVKFTLDSISWYRSDNCIYSDSAVCDSLNSRCAVEAANRQHRFVSQSGGDCLPSHVILLYSVNKVVKSDTVWLENSLAYINSFQYQGSTGDTAAYRHLITWEQGLIKPPAWSAYMDISLDTDVSTFKRFWSFPYYENFPIKGGMFSQFHPDSNRFDFQSSINVGGAYYLSIYSENVLKSYPDYDIRIGYFVRLN